MSIRDVIKIESDISVEQVIRIPFEFTRTGSVPEEETLEDHIVITPLTVRTWFRMKPLLMQIEEKDMEKLVARTGVEFDNELCILMGKYDELLFEVVCLGIYNDKGEMPEWYREALKDNCSWEDIYILLNTIFFRLGYNPFINTITLLRNVSPLGEEEIIALQKNRTSWNPKVTSCF